MALIITIIQYQYNTTDNNDIPYLPISCSQENTKIISFSFFPITSHWHKMESAKRALPSPSPHCAAPLGHLRTPHTWHITFISLAMNDKDLEAGKNEELYEVHLHNCQKPFTQPLRDLRRYLDNLGHACTFKLTTLLKKLVMTDSGLVRHSGTCTHI